MLENLKSNKELLEKGKKFNYYNFLIESPAIINKDFRINGDSYLYQLDHSMDSEDGIEDEHHKKAIHDLLEIRNKKRSSNFYILRLKVVDLTQKEVEHPITKLSQVVDPEIGIGVSPSNICKDFINLFSLYFGAWFKIVPNFFFFEKTNLIALIKLECREIAETKVGNDLTKNYDYITSLREEQFYLIQKSLSRFNQSLKSVDEDLELGLILLVSTIENLSRKYGKVEEEFDESNEFYNKLKKVFNNLPKENNNNLLNNLFDNIGQAYLNISHLKIKAKYKNFCLNSVSSFIFNEKFEEMIGDLYDLRSKILHAGEIIGYYSREQLIMYNPRKKSGKIKTYSGEKGKHLIIIRIPSYNDLLKIFADVIVNFINYLYSVKDDEEDKALYKESDKRKRNILVGSINKDGYKPGYVVNLNSDFYRRVDFIDLTQIENMLKIIEWNKDNANLEDRLKKVEELLQYSNFSTDFIAFRRACYFKIIFLHDLKKYEECLEMFEKYNITEINEETHGVFNTKAYCLAIKGEFKEAQIVINKLLKLVKNDDYFKACYLDSKGDLYKMEGNYSKAIEYYKKSLEIKGESKFPFHEETIIKLKECEDHKSKVSK